MAQVTDYNIANASGASVRSDLNSVFSAIKTLNSGSSDPANTEAFMPYVDTGDNNNLKIRNASNNGFTTIGPVNETNLGLLPKAGGAMTGQFLAHNGGSESTPAIAFNGDPDTGLFRSTANQIDIATNGTNRFRITGNGGVFLGKAISQDPVSASGSNGSGIKFVAGAVTDYDSFGLVVNAKDIVGIFNRTNTTGKILEFKSDGSTVVGDVSTNGSTTNYNGNSDYRLKQDINNIDNAITKIKTLRPITFRWKNNVDIGYDSGFIAHEVQETGHYNHLVTGVKDGTDYQGLDYSKFTPMLVAALQESVAKIETLEAKVAALEAK